MHLRLCAAVAALLMVMPVLAEDCSKIADKTARLECFDKTAAAPAPAPAAAPARERAATSARCQGITKKGAQCKRNAQAGRSYCYQHGP